MRPYAVFLLLSAIGLPASASAVDIVNADRQSREVTIAEANRPGVWSLTIEPGETLANVCETCTIEVDRVGRVDASGSDVVTIRDGGLRKGGS